MVSVQANTLYAIQEVPGILPARADGKTVHPGTVWRWMTRGVKGRKLAFQMVGGRRFISGQSLLDFLSSAAPARPEVIRAIRTTAARKQLSKRYGF